MSNLSSEKTLCENGKDNEISCLNNCLLPARLELPMNYGKLNVVDGYDRTADTLEHQMDTINKDDAVTNMTGSPDWSEVVYARKRHNADNLENHAKRVNRDPRHRHSKLSFVGQNRFEPLSENDSSSAAEPRISTNPQEPSRSSTLKTTDLRPPPIHLMTEVNFNELRKYLNNIIDPASYYFVSTRSGVTIYPSTSDTYRSLVRCFREKDAQFHTYQLADDKPYRVVIRGLHSTLVESEIATELTEQGFPVRAVTNILSREKVKLPLFYVDLEPNSSNGNIYNLKSLFQTKITIEAPRKSRDIVQCSRCQRYGHTRKYCNLPARCVKCAGQHITSTCTKLSNTPATCALCGLAHPANYRGCSVHQALKQRRRAITEITHNRPGTLNNRPKNGAAGYSVPQTMTTPINPHRSSSLTYSQAVSPPQHVQQPPEGNIVSSISLFITEMKQLISPMINLMSQLIQVLLEKHAN